MYVYAHSLGAVEALEWLAEVHSLLLLFSSRSLNSGHQVWPLPLSKKAFLGAGEMAQQLRAVALAPEDTDLVPITYQFVVGNTTSSTTYNSLQEYTWCTCIHVSTTLIHIKIIRVFLSISLRGGVCKILLCSSG